MYLTNMDNGDSGEYLGPVSVISDRADFQTENVISTKSFVDVRRKQGHDEYFGYNVTVRVNGNGTGSSMYEKTWDRD